MDIPMALQRENSKQAAASRHRGESSPSPGGNLPSDRYLTRLTLLLRYSKDIVPPFTEKCNMEIVTGMEM